MKKCNRCNQEKNDECFAWKVKSKGTKNSFCKECRNLYTQDHYKRNKQQYQVRIRKYDKKRKKELFDKLLLYLSDKSCKVCGESDIRVLEFDHRDRNEKEDSIYKLVSVGCSWKKILTEIDKCDILCANCHKKRTNIQFGMYRQRFLEKKIISEVQDVRRGISDGS